MFTLVHGHSAHSVKVASMDGNVEVRVPSNLAGLPSAVLTRDDVHDALVEAKEQATHFLAAVDADIEATACMSFANHRNLG